MPRGVYPHKPVSESSRLKMSESRLRRKKRLGYLLSPIAREKISEALKGKKRPKEVTRKMSEAQKGDRHYNWQGGITDLNTKIRRSLEYRLWRTSVFERDNYTCVWCGDNRGGNLQADHIKPFSLFPELRFAIDNGRTLCFECHKKT